MNYKKRLQSLKSACQGGVCKLETYQLMFLISLKIQEGYEEGYKQGTKDQQHLDLGRTSREILPVSARATLYTKDQGWIQ